MPKRILRLVLLFSLIAVLALRFSNGEQVRPTRSLVEKLTSLSRDRGLTPAGELRFVAMAGAWSQFRTPDCAMPLRATPVDPAQVTAVERQAPPGWTRTYAYMGWQASEFHRLPVALERLKSRIWRAVGGTGYVYTPEVMLGIAPPGCVWPNVWGDLWRPDRH